MISDQEKHFEYFVGVHFTIYFVCTRILCVIFLFAQHFFSKYIVKHVILNMNEVRSVRQDAAITENMGLQAGQSDLEGVAP